MPPASDRATARLEWTRQVAAQADVDLQPASSDASFRSYWRLVGSHPPALLMDSPPALEDPLPWLEIGRRLHDAGLHVPEVYAAELEQGLLLIEDMGDRLYLPALNADSVDSLYQAAMQALLTMQVRVDTSGLALYDTAFLRRELELLPEWFLQRHLGIDPAPYRSLFDACFEVLLANAAEQPQGFVHRDYHSRNLLITDQHSPGIIDFQGALIGPISYDLASLLRDCYIRWPEDRVQTWIEAYRQALIGAERLPAEVGTAQFQRWTDLTGLQRHCKVLGLFCRLAYRDGKLGYLQDLPRVHDYVVSIASRYTELQPLAELLTRIDHRQPISSETAA